MYDPATSRALWTLCRGYAALYNAGLEALRNEPALPLQNTAKEGIGLYGRLTEWRSTGRYGADALLEALDKGTKLPRRVERAEPSMGPRFRTRKKLDRTGTNQVSFITDVKQRSPRCFTLPGGLELRTTKGLQGPGDVVSAQVMERTPKKFARAGCTPEQRTFALHVQYRVPAPVPGSVTKVRTAPGMRDEHTVQCEAVVDGTVGCDLGVKRLLTVAMPDGTCIHATGPGEKQAEKHKQALAKAKRLGAGTRRGRPGRQPSKRWREAQQIRTSVRRHAGRQRTDRVRKFANRIVRTPGVEAVSIDGVQAKNMTASARGTSEAPGTNVAPKRGLNRGLNHAAPGETNAILERAAIRNGLWTVRTAPAHTSTTCHRCGHRDTKSRESQARFRCTGCGWAGNADDNAALVNQARGRKRLGAYLRAVAGEQRREGVASRPARSRLRRVPVLRMSTGDDAESRPCVPSAGVTDSSETERTRVRTALTEPKTALSV